MSKWKERLEAEQQVTRVEAQEEEQEQEAEIGTLEDVEKNLADSLNVDEALSSFIERRKKESGRIRDITDTSYYFCVCFSNLDQLIEFCETFGLDAQRMYFDGRDFAKALRRELRTPDTQRPKEQAPSIEYVRRSRGTIVLEN